MILGKPLGIGILSAALKKGKLSESGYRQMIEWTTKLNTPGEALADMPAVHALTDVTGFGLAGHLLEICRGSRLSAEVDFSSIPIIGEALDWVKQGVATGASTRNWAGYGHDVEFSGEVANSVARMAAKAADRPANQRRIAGCLRAGFTERSPCRIRKARLR